MSQILVCGLINLEVTLRVDRFPIEYQPVRYPFFGVRSSISGVGYNLAKALTILGDEVRLLSIIGRDSAATLVRTQLSDSGISGEFIIDAMTETPHSVVLYDREGKRQINTDMKDIQEQVYPEDLFDRAIADCPVAVLCNLNLSRPFLRKVKQAGKLIATDIHTISNLEDDYNRDFMASADILFMSDEHLPCSPEAWAKQLRDRYGNEIIVIGLGERGALLSVKSDNLLERIPTARVRPIVNTVGAGDALFASFLHLYCASGDPYLALEKAVLFASYKIGEAGAAAGFLNEAQLEELYRDRLKELRDGEGGI